MFFKDEREQVMTESKTGAVSVCLCVCVGWWVDGSSIFILSDKVHSNLVWLVRLYLTQPTNL